MGEMEMFDCPSIRVGEKMLSFHRLGVPFSEFYNKCALASVEECHSRRKKEDWNYHAVGQLTAPIPVHGRIELVGDAAPGQDRTDVPRFLSAMPNGQDVTVVAADDRSGRQHWELVHHPNGDYWSIIVRGGVAGFSGTEENATWTHTTPRYLTASRDGNFLNLTAHDDESGKQRWRLERVDGNSFWLKAVKGPGAKRLFLGRRAEGAAGVPILGLIEPPVVGVTYPNGAVSSNQSAPAGGAAGAGAPYAQPQAGYAQPQSKSPPASSQPGSQSAGGFTPLFLEGTTVQQSQEERMLLSEARAQANVHPERWRNNAQQRCGFFKVGLERDKWVQRAKVRERETPYVWLRAVISIAPPPTPTFF